MTIAPAKFVHVVYRTRRFDEMIEWYKTVFGARVQYQDPGLAFLTYDDEHHRFAFANMALLDPTGGGPDDRGPIGVDHVAYTYASLADLFDQYAELKAEGITPYWCIHHGITVSMYYGDPDGNQMEFQVDCLADNEDANALMRRSFAANRTESSTTPTPGSLTSARARQPPSCSPGRPTCPSRQYATPGRPRPRPIREIPAGSVARQCRSATVETCPTYLGHGYPLSLGSTAQDCRHDRLTEVPQLRWP